MGGSFRSESRRGLVKMRYDSVMDHAERYWAKVDFSDPTGCWLWTAAVNSDGYGIWQPVSGWTVPAHRFGWELLHGPIASGMCVCHHCDNPACQRPDHWFLGTHADNMRDCTEKGRNRSHRNEGSKHGRARLDEAAVLEIRRQSADGVTGRDLARAFGTSRANISLIIKRKAWTHI